MEFLMDPSIWAGLLTLVVLEIVLGIDNLVFIAILADKLPPKQRDKARLLGLSLALIMRLGLLSLISWMVTLTKPLFTVMDFSFSAPIAMKIYSKPAFLRSPTVTDSEKWNPTPHSLMNSTSSSIAFSGILNSGIVLLTTPPAVASFS